MTAKFAAIPNEPVCKNCLEKIMHINTIIIVHGITIYDEDNKSCSVSGEMKFCSLSCLNTFICRLANDD